MNLTSAILLSAVVTTAYTVLGGCGRLHTRTCFSWGSSRLPAAALPFVIGGAGGLHHVGDPYAGSPERRRPESVRRRLAGYVGDADLRRHTGTATSARVCAGRRRRQPSIGVVRVSTIAFTVPPLLMGIAAFRLVASRHRRARVATPATMPLLFAAVPPVVGLLGLSAIGAVTSSFSSSILSAGRCSAGTAASGCCGRRLLRR